MAKKKLPSQEASIKGYKVFNPGFKCNGFQSLMSDAEKEANPKHETTEGYLKTITMHEAWANMWGNLSKEDKAVFTTLPNFDAVKFFTITGIQV